MTIQRPRYVSPLFDSARWDEFEFRKGDIVICTPAKCGTTWTQMICALLIFQTPKFDRPLSSYSPWLDMNLRTQQEVYDLLAAQSHRRFIKTHTPLDGLPIVPEATYVCVGRDPRDAIISLANHIENMNHDAFNTMLARVNGEAPEQGNREESVNEGNAEPPDTLEQRFWKWVYEDDAVTERVSTLKGTLHHYCLALNEQVRSNIFVMHYAAMKAGLEGEMRRLAAALQIDVPERTWPSLVDAAKFDNMRENAPRIAPDAELGVWKDSHRFFHSGKSGYWTDFFTQEAFARYKGRAEELAAPEVLRWAHQGSTPQIW